MTQELDIFGIPAGVATSGVYVVEYAEDLWRALDPDRQLYCLSVWMGKAKGAKVRHAVLRLIPDPLFPLSDKEKPYVEWQQKLDYSGSIEINVRSWCEITIVTPCDRVPPELQNAINNAVAAMPVGCKYTVLNTEGDTLIQGRV
jgi:hypothetical protein